METELEAAQAGAEQEQDQELDEQEREEREREEQERQLADELNIRPGMTAEVLTLDNRLTFVGRVDRFNGKAIILRESRGGELPPVLYNKEIKLRFFRGQDSLVVHGKICGSSRTIWKLDRLESRSAKEQRAFFRQRISPNAQADCTKLYGPERQEGETLPCQVLDVSAGGLLMSSHTVYEVNDHLRIDALSLVGGMEDFVFECQVRRAGRREIGQIRYGCQFESISPKEQDRLLQAIFEIQRREIRTQKERDGM